MAPMASPIKAASRPLGGSLSICEGFHHSRCNANATAPTSNAAMTAISTARFSHRSKRAGRDLGIKRLGVAPWTRRGLNSGMVG